MTSPFSLEGVPEAYHELFPALREIVLHFDAAEQHSLDEESLGELAQTRSRELARQLLQAHLLDRHAREDRSPMVGADGIERGRHQRRTKQKLLSVVGKVDVVRKELRDPYESGGLRPLDAELNLPRNLYSFGVLRLVAWFASRLPFDGVVDTIERTHGLFLGKRQVEEAAVNCARDFEAYYEATMATPVDGADLLVLSFDGKGVVMRTDSLRPATKKAAASSKNKLKHRLSPGEKSGRKRMAEVAAVYELPPSVRSVDDILSTGDTTKKRPPRARNKRVWASLEKDAKTVIDEAFDEALSRDPEHEKNWVVLVDGNKDQLRYARRAAKRVGASITIVVDLVHVIEYLWKAAWVLFDKGDEQAEHWVTERIRRLLMGQSSSVAAGIRRSATKRGLEPDARAPMDKCSDYLLKYKKYLAYDDFLARGMPIATGVIEGACRHLVKDRMDITGARWGLERAEAILRLRALHSSGDFDDYWDFHKRRELERNHLDNYAMSEFAELRDAA